MTHIILLEDAPDASPDIRKTHMAAHLDFLESHADIISAAGPLHNGQGHDGLWILETDDVDKIEALIRADPFWPTGLRKSYTILKWTQVFANGQRKINH